MKEFFLVLVFAFVVTISISAQVSTVSNAQASADSYRLAEAKLAIEKGNAQWSEGWLKGDAGLVAAIFTDDGVQLGAGGKIIRGPKAIMERQKAAMAGADPGVKVTAITTDIWVDGDTAYETGKYKYVYTVKGKPGTDEGKYVTIWRRQKDGSWKLSMDMGVPND